MSKKNKYLSLTARVEVEIRNRIHVGIYPTYSLLPSQEKLAQEFSVSRITIREVFRLLQEKKLIISYKGKGAVVQPIVESYGIHGVGGFSEYKLEENHHLSTNIIMINTQSFYQPAQENLKLNDETSCIHIQRLRSINNIKVELENSYLNPLFFPEQNWHHEINSSTSLYEFIKTKYHITINSAEEDIFAILPDVTVQKLMDIDEITSILYIKRNTFAQEFLTPFEYCENFLLSGYLGRLKLSI